MKPETLAAPSETASNPSETGAEPAPAPRIRSIDALRGLVMFLMIFVNDLAGVSNHIVPRWMKHFHGKSGMTFVDLVFPGFLFIVGMSLPFAIGSRLNRGEPLIRTVFHILIRTVSLLFIGILMVNETPDSAKMGWSGALWSTLMFLSAIFAFCSISPPRTGRFSPFPAFRFSSMVLRAAGFLSLFYLAWVFRGEDGHRIVTLSPFSVHTEWYGILGLIGWAYFISAIVYLLFRENRTALLGCMVLLFCLYPADRKGAFHDFWLSNYVGIGEMFGSHAAITLAGVLLATILINPGASTLEAPDKFRFSAFRLPAFRFSALFITGCAAAAWLLNGLYGISKNNATPSWCLWACAFTATLWVILYFVCDVRPIGLVSRPLAIAGENVLLAYLLSEMLPSTIELFHLDDWYGALAEPTLTRAIIRSAGCAVLILCATAGLNRIGFRLKL